MAQVYKGYNGAALQAARIAGESAEMDAVAARVVTAARTLASGHGSLADAIGTEPTRGKRGVTDRLVTMDHVAAVSIEFGHRTRGGRSYVEGLHILGRAAGRR